MVMFYVPCYEPCLHFSSYTELTSFTEASKFPHWRFTMNAEYDALLQNHTWNLVPPPYHVNVIGCRWIFKIKRRADGIIERYKARLVTEGYNQQHGVDNETYNPVVKPDTIRLVLSIAISNNWSIRQLDIQNAFLHANLAKTICMANLLASSILNFLTICVRSNIHYMALNRLLASGFLALLLFWLSSALLAVEQICLSLFTIRNLAPYIYLYMLMTLLSLALALALMIMPLPNLFKSYDKSLPLKILALSHSFWALKLYKIIQVSLSHLTTTLYC